MTSWIDRINAGTDRPEPPPKAGKGSTTTAWREYATAVGYQIPAGSSRSDIIATVEAGPPPAVTTGSRSAPQVEGALYESTVAAVEAASHLTVMDQATVAVILELAKTIDGMPHRPATAPMDNVTIPTFLRYAEALGLSPAARARIDIRPPEKQKKLTALRTKTHLRAVG